MVDGVRLKLSPVWAATVVGEVGPHVWQTPCLAAWVAGVVGVVVVVLPKVKPGVAEMV